jgi:hypothetical protein
MNSHPPKLPARRSACSLRTLIARACILTVSLGLCWANTAHAGKPTVPAVPSNLSATAVSSSQINLAWTDNSSNESGFRIQRAAGSAGPWTQIAIVGAGIKSYANTGLAASTMYYYRVCAYNRKGDSSYANIASATTLPAAACTYSLSATSASFAAAGGSGSVSVTAGAGCAWTAASGASWITITAGTSGSGNGTVSYSVAPNTSGCTRTGPLTIAGQTFTVTQAGAACAYSLSATSASFSAAAGSGSVSVTAAPCCLWTASSGAFWITINAGSGGSGNGTVYYSVAANTSTSPRVGTMTLAGQTFTVTQAAAAAGDTTPPTVSLTAPTSGSTVSGTITLSATASDNVGVSRVEFYCDSTTLVGSATAAPYSVTEDTTALANGSHSFCAKAYDAAGNSTTSVGSTVTVGNGTPGQLQWVQAALCSPGSQVWPRSVSTDSAGNVIAAGYFQSTVDFGGGVLSSAGGMDAFIVKYSPQGALLWARRFGAGYDDTLYGAATDGAGNVVVAGFFSGTVDFGGVVLTSVPTPGYGYAFSDAFVAKYSPTGSLLWVQTFGGILSESVYGVAVDGSGNIFLAAALGSANVVFGGFTLSSAGGYDVMLAKLSPQGAVLWAERWGGANNDQPKGIAVDRSGNPVVVGNWGGGDLGGGGVAAGLFVAKYSGADGRYQWAKVVPSGGSGNGIAIDPGSGNVVITGLLVGGPVDFGTGPTASAGIFLAAYSSAGANLWAKTFNNSICLPSAYDSANAVSVDGNGNIAFTGVLWSTVNFGAGWVSGGMNCFTAGFTGSGTYRWVKLASAGSTGYGIGCDALGRVSIAGSFKGTVDFGGITKTATSFYGNPFVAHHGP